MAFSNTVANLSGFLAPQTTGYLLNVENSLNQVIISNDFLALEKNWQWLLPRLKKFKNPCFDITQITLDRPSILKIIDLGSLWAFWAYSKIFFYTHKYKKIL